MGLVLHVRGFQSDGLTACHPQKHNGQQPSEKPRTGLIIQKGPKNEQLTMLIDPASDQLRKLMLFK